MPLSRFTDVECEDLDVKSNAAIADLSVTTGAITTANITTETVNAVTATTINASAITTTTVTATNVDFRLGQLQRSFGIVTGKDDIASTGVAPVRITFPAKAKIAKFGFMSSGSDVVIATTFNALLQTTNATVLGTAFVGVADYTLGSNDATKFAITATSVRANHGVQFNIATAGVSGSVYWFVDYRLNST